MVPLTTMMSFCRCPRKVPTEPTVSDVSENEQNGDEPVQHDDYVSVIVILSILLKNPNPLFSDQMYKKKQKT